VRIVLASRYEETAVYTIKGKEGDVAPPWVETTSMQVGAAEVRKAPGSKSSRKQAPDPRQMTLF